MAATSAQAEGADTRAQSFVKSPTSVIVIAIGELALGVLGVGLVLEAQAVRSNAGLDYVAVVAYASSAALTASLVLLGLALCSSVRTRFRRLFRADIGVALVAAAATVGNLIALQIHDWTTTITCDGCDPTTVAPTANEIAASIVLDLGAGALAALLPTVAVLLLRGRRESVAKHP